MWKGCSSCAVIKLLKQPLPLSCSWGDRLPDVWYNLMTDESTFSGLTQEIASDMSERHLAMLLLLTSGQSARDKL